VKGGVDNSHDFTTNKSSRERAYDFKENHCDITHAGINGESELHISQNRQNGCKKKLKIVKYVRE
jgi:hypothetical protein